MRKTTGKIILFLMAAVAFSAFYFVLRVQKTANENNVQKDIEASLSAQNQPETAKMAELENKAESNQEEPAPKEQSIKNIPEKFLLEIPFYSQAPLSKWDAFHEDMCEEASLLGAGLYLEDKKLARDEFESELQKIQNIEKKEIGEWKSTTVSQAKKWADIYFGGNLSIKIIDNPTIENIESEISAGNPVVAPLSGRDIGNPNFTPPGPVYHMLIIKGYDEKNFITNDVGTRKGNSYVYKKEVIMKNIYDWDEKDIHLGGKKVLVLYK